MDREELVGIQTIWWVDYQLAVGFLTGSWKSNMDVWISNQLFGNPTACLSWPRCNGDVYSPYLTITPHLPNLGQALWMAYPKTIRYAPLQNNIS